MATYFHGNSEIQAADGLQTLVLMNPGYVHYTDTLPPPPPPSANLFFLNSAAANSLSTQTLHHAPPPHTQQFTGIPLPPSASPQSHDPNSHDISALHGFFPRVKYSLWNPIDPSTDAREILRTQQGLSLSLSSQQPNYGLFRPEREAPLSGQHTIPGEEMRVSGGGSSSSGITNGVSGVQGVLISSKYLKATQELLEEVVNVGSDGIKNDMSKKAIGQQQNKVMDESSVAAAGDASIGTESAGKQTAELTTAERQEIQMKKAKLISMLDEVEQRYRQYNHQMQIVISSFEHAAGVGSARTYTSLALETISKQFRCLKDTITTQIRGANKSLGEDQEEGNGGKFEGSRLKFVDNHIRQQRALQQLGMIQHNAWRPQRGLPERSVSVLRAWLFEHFLHPYPKDSDKQLLAKQTGLTRSQVSNWFINARVRLWKPMVEEMYMEEIKEQEKNVSPDKMTKLPNNQNSPSSKSTSPQHKPPLPHNPNYTPKHDNSSPTNPHPPPSISISAPPPPSSISGTIRNLSGFSLIGSSELDGITQSSPKKQRIMNIKEGEVDHDQAVKFDDERQTRDGYSFMLSQSNFNGGFGQYPIGEIGRFDDEQFTPRFSGNGVSLTLGLPHCENHTTFLPNHNNIHLGRRIEHHIGEANDFGVINTSSPHSSTPFDNIEIQNRKRFVAQLLPDFVA